MCSLGGDTCRRKRETLRKQAAALLGLGCLMGYLHDPTDICEFVDPTPEGSFLKLA
jgi:hypothetical protein